MHSVFDNGVFDNGSLHDLWQAWTAKQDEDALIDADFECTKETCMYRWLCMATILDGRHRIGKWCPYYAEKLMEDFQKSNKSVINDENVAE